MWNIQKMQITESRLVAVYNWQWEQRLAANKHNWTFELMEMWMMTEQLYKFTKKKKSLNWQKNYLTETYWKLKLHNKNRLGF